MQSRQYGNIVHMPKTPSSDPPHEGHLDGEMPELLSRSYGGCPLRSLTEDLIAFFFLGSKVGDSRIGEAVTSHGNVGIFLE
jgi:hypothetical protein